jgi:hypothetical protein
VVVVEDFSVKDASEAFSEVVAVDRRRNVADLSFSSFLKSLS